MEKAMFCYMYIFWGFKINTYPRVWLAKYDIINVAKEIMKKSSNYQVGHVEKKTGDDLMDIFSSKEHEISVANELVDNRILRKSLIIEFVRNGLIVLLNQIWRFNYE